MPHAPLAHTGLLFTLAQFEPAAVQVPVPLFPPPTQQPPPEQVLSEQLAWPPAPLTGARS